MKHILLATLACITLIPEVNAQGVALLNVNDVQMRVVHGRIGRTGLSVNRPGGAVSNGTGIVVLLWFMGGRHIAGR